MFRSVVWCSVCFFIMAAATAARCAEAERGTLEGTWIAKSMEKDGKKAPEDAVKCVRFRFVGDKLFVRGNYGDEREVECSFAVDATKEPKHLDFTPPKGKEPTLAIYERKEKTLRMCVRHSGSHKGRPTEFEATKGSDLILIVFSLQDK